MIKKLEIYDQETRNSINPLIFDKIQQLETLYKLENQNEISQFISEHYEIVSLILEVYKQIRIYFPDEKLTLKVQSDYEYSEWQKLNICIWANLNFADEAFNKLSEFDQNWWIDASGGVGVNICITLEFE